MDRSLLARATDSSEAPTPGYLYVDLAKQAASNPSVCQDMVKYLVNRLNTKQSTFVKTKCCKVLAKLCEAVPRNQFRRVVAQDAHAVSCIKQALQFRGPLDPLQGDAKNEAVRTAAREALDAVYAEAPAETGGNSMMMGMNGGNGGGGYGGVSQSYGSAPHAANGGGAAPMGGRRMEGIGNPMFSDPRFAAQAGHGGVHAGPSPNFKAAVQEAGEVVLGMIRDPLARNVGASGGHHPHPSVPAQGHSGDLPGYNRSAGSYGRPPPGAQELSRQTGGQWTMASNRGPGAYNSNSYYQERANQHTSGGGAPTTSVSSGGVGGSWGNAAAAAGGVAPPSTSIASQAREPAYGTPSIHITPNRNPTSSSAAVGDGSYEKNLIKELCPPGGLKAVPPADKLQDFCKAVPNLNADWICPVLLDALEDGQPWIIRAKALCVMEAAVQYGGRDDQHPYRDFFFACREEIEPLARHARPAIAEPAKRVLTLLGITNGSSGGGGAAASHRAAAAAPMAAPVAAPNLLDFGDDDAGLAAAAAPAPPPASAPPPPPSGGGSGGSSLFGGMQVKSKAATAAAPAVPAAAPPLAAPPAADLFDFGDSGQPPTTASAASSVTDPFGAMDTPAPAPSSSSQQQPPSSMFAQLQVKDDAASASAPAAAAAEQPASGSAFGFINSSSSAPAPAADAHAPAPSFDPLTSMQSKMTPDTQKKMMQMSPEQLQAMAYQQMMMQQQMQQMQMAMMRGGAPPMPPVYRQTSGSQGMPMMPQQHHHHPGMSFQQQQQGPRAAKKDDKKFDFVKDAMFSEKTK